VSRFDPLAESKNGEIGPFFVIWSTGRFMAHTLLHSDRYFWGVPGSRMAIGNTSEIPAGQSASFWGQLMVFQRVEPSSSAGVESRGLHRSYPGCTCEWAAIQPYAGIAPPETGGASNNDRGA